MIKSGLNVRFTDHQFWRFTFSEHGMLHQDQVARLKPE
ncbi:hypothetical protein IYQ_22440 [Aeromonas salmonicida subsp. salmonicida 01-B526]|uniref:Uncharacterized protein n=1 Tax=Aeromonas salmonicida subsp. salmonicida 01-B526 TaxID=1076135 RepID=A0ABN0DTK5_AERSS|nr:hypothetical protein IYQ_22440 [Aeromonas salmonicida subsp. salmonicida 01-B526]